jgi:hypothetical protein
VVARSRPSLRHRRALRRPRDRALPAAPHARAIGDTGASRADSGCGRAGPPPPFPDRPLQPADRRASPTAPRRTLGCRPARGPRPRAGRRQTRDGPGGDRGATGLTAPETKTRADASPGPASPLCVNVAARTTGRRVRALRPSASPAPVSVSAYAAADGRPAVNGGATLTVPTACAGVRAPQPCVRCIGRAARRSCRS